MCLADFFTDRWRVLANTTAENDGFCRLDQLEFERRAAAVEHQNLHHFTSTLNIE